MPGVIALEQNFLTRRTPVVNPETGASRREDLVRICTATSEVTA